MTKLKEFRYVLIKKIFGILLILLFATSSFGIFSHFYNGFTLGTRNINNNILNYLFFATSEPSKILFVVFEKSSFLIPVFFLFNGLKIIFSSAKSYFIFRFFSLIIFLTLFNFFQKTFLGSSGIIGEIFYSLIYYNNSIFANFYLKLFFALISLALLLILLFYSLAIKIKFLNFATNVIYRLIYVLCRFIFNLFGISFIKKFFLKTKAQKINTEELEIKKQRIKKEPTLNKSQASRSFVSNEDVFSDVYELPPLSLLKFSNEKQGDLKDLNSINKENAKKLQEILMEYGVEGEIINFKSGPVITLFEFLPAAGVKTSKVVSLTEDIARAMSSLSTRISSQPGKTSIGIEIPNTERKNVLLGDLINDDYFLNNEGGLLLALGKDISGTKKYADLQKMPHLLIAGTTGSGKSVGINSMILSLLFKFKPSECKLILVDPKMLELSIYEDIPHLLTPVVTDPKKAVFALKWVVREMENRYKLMSSANVKNIDSFNNKIENSIKKGLKIYRQVQTGIDVETKLPIIEKKELPLERLPLIVVVIDEMADLMMVAGKEVEHLVQRLAQMARASGIHLITATQRPSVDVITGTIKANFPSRISFRVASRFDSRTILNEMGAEQLLGSGDMLILENGASLRRVHGGFVSEEEIERIVKFINSQSVNESRMDITNEDSYKSKSNEFEFEKEEKNIDELYDKAVSIVIEKQKVSTSYIQRYLQIGYNRAARIIEQMENDQIISEANHMGKRSVLKKN